MQKVSVTFQYPTTQFFEINDEKIGIYKINGLDHKNNSSVHLSFNHVPR